MKLKKLLAAAATLTVSLSSGMALADEPPCDPGGITVVGAGSVTCLGYFAGNLNGNATTWMTVNTDLAPWGVTLSGPVSPSNMLSGMSGTGPFSFSQTLYGDTIIGIHYGAIKNPDPPPPNSTTDVTAFYRFNAGTTGITVITNNIPSISDATLFKTGMPSTVPEPETYAMMLAGLGVMGMLARRRKQR